MYSIIRAPLSGAVSEREKANRSLARRACAEGMVLLKNKGALPLSGGEVCLFGRGVRRPQYGGAGSGETRPRERVNVEQGFLNAGWRVLTARWLDETDAEYAASFSAWEKNRKKGEKRRADLLSLSAGGRKFSPPYGVAIGREDALSDTAVYVLTRKAGEGCDRRPEKGDFLIADEELEHLRAMKKLFAKTVLVINAGGLVDLSFDEELDLDAIVYGVQGGMESGNALADVLTGKTCFCGKLADSWGADYDAYPYAREYGGLNGDISRDIYKEDVFVGYKWFESLGIRPRYPFGFGLSYTDFCIENEEVSLIGGRAVVIDIPKESSYALLYNLAKTLGTWDHPMLQGVCPPNPYPIEFVAMANWRTTEEKVECLRRSGYSDFRFMQTLTRVPLHSDSSVEEPSEGCDRGSYVAITATFNR